MRIMVKAFATLSSYQPEGGELEVDSSATVVDVLRYGQPPTRPGLSFMDTPGNDLASVSVHPDLDAAWDALNPERVYAFTTGAQTGFADVRYRPGDVLMFGPEPTGLDETTLADPHITEQVRIPMLPGRRSLNLSNAAAVAAYEAWRQHGFAGGR